VPDNKGLDKTFPDKIFNEPRLALNRIYTKGGDQGETSLVGGQRVPKDDPRIEAFGTVDELNAFVGLARMSCQDLSLGTGEPSRAGPVRPSELLGTLMDPAEQSLLQERSVARASSLEALAASLLRVQHELFNLGSILATRPEDVHPRQPRVTDAEVEQLEREIYAANADLAPLRSFALPGGTRLNAELHAARTICRRAERLVTGLAQIEELPPEAIRYLNRLSDALFVWSRSANQILGVAEVLWEPNQTASGKKHSVKTGEET
jgi:cob(I)alamin adenosyltransferase